MAKTSTQFKASDSQRKKQHSIPSPTVRTHHYHLDKREWAAAFQQRPADSTRSKTRAAGRENGISKRKPAMRAPHRPFDVLRASDLDECLHCGTTGNDRSCGTTCYRLLRKTFIDEKKMIDIRLTPDHGYGAFTKPGVSIESGRLLNEYVGAVRPHVDKPYTSLYMLRLRAEDAVRGVLHRR